MKSEYGGITLNLTLSIIIFALCGVGYALWKRQTQQDIITNSDISGNFDLPVKKQSGNVVFTDGLENPEDIQTEKADEFGVGIVKVETFSIDINNDNTPDRITKIRHESGTAHFWDEYKIEINKNGRFRNITPNGFRTTTGAECALQQLQFRFKPYFHIIKISRPWTDSWNNPSMATRTIYTVNNDRLIADTPEKIRSVCDVAELFKE